jgi:glucokinase
MSSPEYKLVFAGLDLGATDLKYGLVDSSGNVLVSQKVKTEKGQKKIAWQLQVSAYMLRSFALGKECKIGRMGVGSPGAVNFDTGEIMGNSLNLPGWRGANIKKILADTGIPVYADNDANCAALAEHLFGAARGCRSALCVTVGTGIGGGLILDGKIYRGASFAAGEVGHTTVVYNGEKCACGNRGCLEKYASVTALLKAARTHLDHNKKSGLKRYLENGRPSVRALVQAARKKEKSAVLLIQQQAAYLAAGLASAINLINPERLIIGGGFPDVYPEFVRMIEKEVRKRAFPAAVKDLKILKAELGNKAGVVGAAFLGKES